MTVKNKYVKGAHIAERKFRELVRLFPVDLNAYQIADLTVLSRNTVNRYLHGIRVRLAEFCDSSSPFSGEVEVDESFFGSRRVRGKRGRGAYGKTIVFGIFKFAPTSEMLGYCGMFFLGHAHQWPPGNTCKNDN